VIARRQIKWFFFGFALSSVVGATLRVNFAHAQSAPQTGVTPLPSRQLPLRAARPTSQSPTILTDDDGVEAPATLAGNGATDAAVDGDTDADSTDPTQSRRVQTRRAPTDGDPASDTDQMPVQDGVIDVGEPQAAPDGDNPSEVDTRRRADIDAFEKPAVGYDAIAFQIELDPILDRRPARLARFEPYDPVGIRRGSWIIFPDAEISVGRLSNVFSSTSPRGDTVIDVRPTVRAVTNWSRHALELKATGLASFYSDFGSENDRAYALEMRSRFDLSRRTNLEALISTDRSQDSRSDRQASGTAASRADITTNRAAVAVNHQLNRLSLQLRGSVTDTNYGSVPDTSGIIIANDDRDQTTRDVAARASWAFKPSLSAFLEAAVNERVFKTVASDGIARDSKGDRTRIGLAFGNTNGVWRGEISTGYGRQRPDDRRLKEVDGLLIDANLAWRMSAVSSLLFTARTDFTDTTTVGASGALVRTFGVEARHAFQRQLIGTVGLKTAVSEYQGISLTERETTADFGLEYFFSRNASMFTRYQHIALDTTAVGANTVSDSVRVGMKVRQ
jgi:hypothetical protein